MMSVCHDIGLQANLVLISAPNNSNLQLKEAPRIELEFEKVQKTGEINR